MARCETTNQSNEILAARSEFVPTALSGGVSESAAPQVDWQTAMRRAIRCSDELRRKLGLVETSSANPTGQSEPSTTAWNESDACERPSGKDSFPTFVPLEYLARIRPGDPDDPLLRQVLATPNEDVDVDGFSADPVGDRVSVAAAGLLHKYQGRALIITTGACGIHCRYCFRREFPYTLLGSRNRSWTPSLDYLGRHPEIDEVLLSGGDPLTLADPKLGELVDAIEAIDHVRRLRFHTRMPIVIPQRVTPWLIERLSTSRLAVWMVVHANHPNELDRHVLATIGKLIDAGIPVLNQAVLLRGVNDDAQVLADLCLKLVDHRIQPYYLHQLDRVRGAAHFEVPVETGMQLMEQLRGMLPGYALPSYVVEQAGADSKTPLVDQNKSGQ